MSDFERYGDYNEVDEPPKKSKVGIALKLFITILCFSVVGFLIFRVFTFNYYPKEAKNIYFTDELTSLYNERGGDIGALTQGLLNSRNFGYDDANEGNFFCKHFIYIPETEELQITLKYNTSLAKNIKDKYGADIDPNNLDSFDFRLVATRASDPEVEDNSVEVGSPMDATLVAKEYSSFLMYRYVKLVFDGVRLDVGTEDEINWIRLEVLLNGIEIEQPYTILIYWNIDEYPLVPYELSKKEKP